MLIIYCAFKTLDIIINKTDKAPVLMGLLLEKIVTKKLIFKSRKILTSKKCFAKN